MVATVGSASANLWPVFIGLRQGFFKEQNIEIDLIYVQSSAQMVQQLAAGSLNVTMSTGLVDPIRAIEKGANLAIVRFESQAPPYALVAKKEIKSLKELAGKTISIGGPKDITRIFVERMLAPSGIKSGQFDTVYAGATSARAQALLSGAVDAAILLPPFNFQVVNAGFNELGQTVDFAPELPFSGTVANVAWANANKPVLLRLIAAHSRSVAWFEDEANRSAAVAMLVEASKLQTDEIEKSYDFFRKGHYFEPTGKISRKKLNALIDALVGLGDIGRIEIEKLVLPGVTQLTD